MRGRTGVPAREVDPSLSLNPSARRRETPVIGSNSGRHWLPLSSWMRRLWSRRTAAPEHLVGHGAVDCRHADPGDYTESHLTRRGTAAQRAHVDGSRLRPPRRVKWVPGLGGLRRRGRTDHDTGARDSNASRWSLTVRGERSYVVGSAHGCVAPPSGPCSMSTGPTALKKTPLNAATLPRRPHGPVRRLGHAGRVLRHHRRAHGRARRAPACSTSATWARSRSPARTRWRPSSASRATTPSKLAGRPGPVLRRCSTPAGHVRRRPARLPPGRRALPARRQRRATSTKDYALDRRADRARPATRSPSTRARATRCSPSRGRAALDDPAAADRRRPRRRSSTTGSRTARWPASARTISRTGYTGEDGFEIFVPPAVGRARLARAPRSRRSRPASCPCGLGARDTLRLEAGDAPLRQRHRRDDDACSRPTSAGSSAGRRTTSSARDALRAQKAERRRRASSSASRCSTAASPATATTCTSTATSRSAS